MPRPPRRRWWRCLAALALILLLVVAVPLVAIEGFCRGPLAAAPAAPRDMPAVNEPGYRRNEINTYFTFPEWYIVYSFEDFGRFLERGNESAFPYWRHIVGFWQSFCTINRIAAARPEPLTEMKLMVYTIGISYSLELAIKGIYESSIGRLTEWTRGATRTPEDLLARKVTQGYAEFLHTVPWYKYPFLEKAGALWSDAPLDGPGLLRRWERKLALSAEYGVKSGYAWLIEKALDVSSAPEAREIMLVVSRLPPDVLAREPRIRVIRPLGAERQLIQIPRYKAFTKIVLDLARAGHGIVEIAGNDDILLTAILPNAATPTIAGTRELFSAPLGARPGFRRVGFDVRVEQLNRVVPQLEQAGAAIEHLYDY
jgi:hypothetical protein